MPRFKHYNYDQDAMVVMTCTTPFQSPCNPRSTVQKPHD